MLSRSILSEITLVNHNFVLQESYDQQYAYLKNVNLSLSQEN